ncbi:cytochrome ubiquinol oxidase subunit I [Methylophaga nitratireducenticrescens]|uniref:Cytochrome bd2, subunit I n=1 Tax=Methylophaga nitratireducenticrescens TaxID=754476 RepID=I1XJW5_METNJ|nr:cytochrome ubiquinol oxidase subunit I [Methylophaga nitratireducenticrescens]AFI84684.1 cytochrome ubiquinol oxidase subunit I [Methylophaga nitratireducenticrescens]AUZ84693.1 cytochrome ubiquinol oxidase subunit I [Methylophaga nitratireducenticrescens]
MELDPLILSRIQFAFVVCFHAIFPVFTIGLASFVAVLEALSLKTGNPVWQRLSKFWIQVFAVVFGMGVVSGIVMSFQFGTNWSNFSYATANFLGPILSYEVITAFFLEAGFLGVLLFGRDKVPQGVHFFAALMVAVGTFISSFWILAANSALHTPDGLVMRDGLYYVSSWSDAIFNPSFGYRFLHMGVASFLTASFVVAGVTAWFVMQKREMEANKKALSIALWLILILAPAQVVIGDFHGLNTLEHQPTKVAAMEGNWETSTGVPLLLFAWPDQEAQENHFEIKIPKLASFILTHDWDGEVPGLKEVAPEEQPPVFIVFWAFRVMVGMGMLMVLFGLAGLLLRRKQRYLECKPFLNGLRVMSLSPFIAVLAGWIVTETGRAPWLIYEQMTHAQGLTPSLTGGMALFTLIGYILVYAMVFSAGVFYLMTVFRGGLETANTNHLDSAREKAQRPMSAANANLEGGL